MDKFNEANNTGWGVFVLSGANGGLGFNAGRAAVSSHVIPETNQWQYVAVTYDSLIKFYLNGNKMSEGKYEYDIRETASKPLLIGYSDSLGKAYSCGLIDDVRIYNRALDDNEIMGLYQEGN